MALQHQLRGYFTALARDRGYDYFRQGRVLVDGGDASSLRAYVRGTHQYQVDLARDGQQHIAAWCTCPVTARAELCKHVWAALLAADDRQLLTGDGTTAQTLDLDEERLYPALETGDVALDPDDADGDGDFDAAGVLEREWEHLVREARRRGGRTTRRARPPAPHQPPTTWRDLLGRLPAAGPSAARPLPLHGRREILYVVDAALTGTAGGIVVEIGWRDRRAGGEWGAPKTRAFPGDDLIAALTPEDETALWRLWAVTHGSLYGGVERSLEHALAGQRNQVRLPGPLVGLVMPAICHTGRCRLRVPHGTLADQPLAWDEGPPWTLHLEVRAGGPDGGYVFDYSVRRGDARLSPEEALVLTADGHVLTDTHVARFDPAGGFAWVSLLHSSGPLAVPARDVDDLLAAIAARPGCGPLELDPALGVVERRPAPSPRLVVRTEERPGQPSDDLRADVRFEYEGVDVAWNQPSDRTFDRAARTIVVRDRDAERRALERLPAAGVRPKRDGQASVGRWTLPPDRLPAAVRELSEHGWRVEAAGRVFRRALATRTWIRSGIDWFDLEGEVDFGDVSASIGQVLAALAKGERTVRLSDGSAGLLPEDWLASVGRWAALGEAHDAGVRFGRSQTALLDALLAAAPEVDVDAQFVRARDELRTFDRIAAADAPPAFRGELRPYQREGLGWLRFLERFGFGGCLADDMGLGKTVQVLAALAGRRASNGTLGPSLVVVPRSLVFNWLREAARFAPGLGVLDHTGAGRTRALDDLDAIDVVVTTYGTVRRDASHLASLAFDYIVLDEAHAIKNVDSQTAKAVRLLRGRHRLALTGTPVQNHLGELWSLFEFLNPGVLGRSTVFSRLLDKTSLDESGRTLLARALRPFVLRRTKADVASDLPARVEDTVVCRLEPDERRFYDGLRDHYRHLLGTRIASEGWGKSQMLVLEALLRLRQAACHPGLVDATWPSPASAKLDVLLSHLAEVREEGHKAIVFSQFVTLLQRVRALLDREGVPYEYLDGRTRDREARVDRFQHDPECTLFLVSLKAGGLGLNLTAAEYVFLLDPWWNPAIEAQAIDRAHRIGQTRHVFAYRLIAEDTIEEKVLELQGRKRALADAILDADTGGLEDLTREDLDLLLG